MSILPYYLVFLFPLLTVAGPLLWGTWGFLAVPIMAFIIIPLLDVIIGRDLSNPAPEEEEKWERDRGFAFLTWIYVPVQVGMLLYAAYLFAAPEATLLDRTGWIVTVGLTSGGIGFTVAHELAHRMNRFEQTLSLIILGTVFYGHWRREHISGHHRHVATPLDPATAKLGQGFYRFWLQTVSGTFLSSWRLERELQHRKGRKSPFYNPMLWIVLSQLAFAAVLGLAFAPMMAVFYFAQSFVAFTVLELVNYVEHYGLTRKKLDNGRFERVTPIHSWNNSNRLSNWFLIKLQRHSDHHYKPGRRYQTLRHMSQSPELPAGYPTMILLALVPPAWRRVMDTRLSSYLGSPSQRSGDNQQNPHPTCLAK